MRLRGFELRLGLVRRVLKLTGIDLEEQIALLDDGALLVVLTDAIALDVGADLRGDVADRGPNPLAVDRDVALGHRRDLHRLGWADGGFRSFFAPGRRNCHGHNEECTYAKSRSAHAAGSVLHRRQPEKVKMPVRELGRCHARARGLQYLARCVIVLPDVSWSRPMRHGRRKNTRHQPPRSAGIPKFLRTTSALG